LVGFRPHRVVENGACVPALTAAAPDKLTICISTLDGVEDFAGADDDRVSSQSLAGTFIYAAAPGQAGVCVVLAVAGGGPTGAQSSHTSLGEPGAGLAERSEIVRAGLSRCAGWELTIDEDVADGEWPEAYRNVAIANMLRSYDIFYDDPDEVVRGYIEQCSVL